LSSADSTDETAAAAAADDAPEAVEAVEVDERRQALVARFTDILGDAVVQSHITPGDDVWIRVTRDAWATTADVARNRLGFGFFDFLSAMDWLPSPFGRDMDAQEDVAGAAAAAAAAAVSAADGADADPGAPVATAVLETGYAGGDTRFQLLARVYDVRNHIGVTFRADLPDDDLSAPTWSTTYLGADWHERETREMFGINFVGHPHMVNLYLPGEFEGYPLRKDFPLLARRVKPWPGIVDVEQLPTDGDEDAADDTGAAGEQGGDQ
jgi:NADH-quinone oxidoreductase subunit C